MNELCLAIEWLIFYRFNIEMAMFCSTNTHKKFVKESNNDTAAYAINK